MLVRKLNNLFIIGNGFDISHGINTKYTDFKRWLDENYPTKNNYINNVISYPVTMLHGDENISEEDAAEFIRHCVSDLTDTYEKLDKWKDFETILGEVDWSDFFDEIFDENDKDNDSSLWHTLYNREDLGKTLHLYSTHVEKLFSMWISEITYSPNITPKSFLVNVIKNSYFLTFNYTLTLEEIYKIPPVNICHLHGIKGTKLIFGHGNDVLYDTENGKFGFEIIAVIQRELRKPTSKVIEINKGVFTFLKKQQIKSIYSWGFSFSEVDLCYIEEICRQIQTENIVWYQNNYSSLLERSDQKSKIIQCGFLGTFNTFNA